MAAWSLGGRCEPHADPEPFEIRTSVGWRTVYVCSLRSSLVLAEDETGLRRLAFQSRPARWATTTRGPRCERAMPSGCSRPGYRRQRRRAVRPASTDQGASWAAAGFGRRHRTARQAGQTAAAPKAS
jgi:hypothetical protein